MSIQETWKDIPGYEGEYQASSEGHIRSVDRCITQIGRCGLPFTRQLRGRVLRPAQYCKSGHISVVLKKGTNGKPVHQLVMLAFKGQCPENEEVRHLNGNPLDNSLLNLSYGTRTQNILDVYHQGKAWRKTTKEQALKVKELLSEGLPCITIAALVGVSAQVVYTIKEGRSFAWLS